MQTSLFEIEPEESTVFNEIDLWEEVLPILNNFPDPNKELLPGLAWGTCHQLYTPAFWKLQYLINPFPNNESTHQIGDTLLEEIVQCILGGYGIPSEMGSMAFERLKTRKLIKHNISLESVLTALSEPFFISSNRLVHYRFAKQKSNYIYELLNRSDLNELPCNDDLALRSWLMQLKGIGPKTASWITRNWLRSERVAILDIHLLRAGMITGFFRKDLNINTQYFELENEFLMFCQKLEVRPSDMDAIIWNYMKKNNKLALNILSI